MIGKLRELHQFWHEKRGGYANNTASIYGLANKAESFGGENFNGHQSDRI